MRWLSGPLGGHLGSAVSALVDGQLDPDSAERAWAHALGCAVCRSAVEREVWVKRSLSSIGAADPSPMLTTALHELPWQPADDEAGWSTVAELERRQRLRRGGMLAVGAGTVSAAVIGLGAVSGMIDLDLQADRPSTETTIGGVPRPAP
jgi:hypothetical protein